MIIIGEIMNTYFFDKKINLEEAPEKVNSVVLDNSFNYVRLSNGIHVSGKIGISGDCKCQDHFIPFMDTLDVDLIVPNENIGNLKDLKLLIDSYDCHIVDDSVNFHIKCNLDGYDETKENFEIDKAFKEFVNENNNNIVQEFRESLTEEEEKKLESLLNGDVDIIATNEKEENEEVQELLDYEEEQEPFITIEEPPIEVSSPSNDEAIEKVMKENKAVVNQQVDTSNLFENERFVVFSRFYRAKSNDTYDSIAANNEVDVIKLKTINKNKEIVEGTLIQIPR